LVQGIINDGFNISDPTLFQVGDWTPDTIQFLETGRRLNQCSSDKQVGSARRSSLGFAAMGDHIEELERVRLEAWG
jgi:hypothetical protein